MLRTTETTAARRSITAYPFALFGAWVLAWMCNLALRARFGWGADADTLYWFGMKAAVWVAPALLWIRAVERAPLADFLELRRIGSGVRWGLGVGTAIVVVNYLGKTLPSGAGWRQPHLDLVFVNAVIVSPLVEEITLRGFLQRRLELNGHSFPLANVLTTVVFVAMHLPGWYFQSRATTLAGYTARLLPIAVLSLVFGWTKHRSGSLYGSILAHAINNLDSAVLG